MIDLNNDEASDSRNNVDEASASLADKLETCMDQRKEERFIWITLTVILIDVLWFKDSPNPSLPFVILILQLVILIVIAKRLGVQDITMLLNNIVNKAANNVGNN